MRGELSTGRAEMKLAQIKTLMGGSTCESFTLDFQGRSSKTFVHALIATHFIESKNLSGWKGSQKAKLCKLWLKAELAIGSCTFPST